MATLYVENVPEDLYKALRERARQRRSSIAAEIIALLKENIPTAADLRNRARVLRQLEKLRTGAIGTGAFLSAEEMQREDRSR